ncbi:MAG: hypothetical protein GEU88_05075 [Solirubrobacterales bacterium]|nr:hypothetical protein [Solirubrobacterales bacterium]
MAMLALAALAAAGMAAARAGTNLAPPGHGADEAAGAGARVVIAILPYGTSVEQIARVPELAPGVVSAGIGAVPVAQTYLDIGQGNRTNEKLYEGELPRLYVRDGRVPPPLWERTVRRAAGAPADVVPGLLGSTLTDAGVPVAAEVDSGLATLIAVDRDGAARTGDAAACRLGCGPGLSVIRARPGELGDLAGGLAGGDLLVAIASGARAEQELLPAGIAGEGFDGDLTSASTRTDGVVVSTDIAPTVLSRLGVEVPNEMNGSEITSEAERDPAGVAELQQRLENRPSRETVVLLPLGAWLVLSGLAALAWRRRGASVALRLLGLSCAWTPSLLLVTAALDASQAPAALLVGLGAVALAAAADRWVGGYRALALACAVTVAAYAADVIAGSPLTALSVLGPNPGGGVRFFGIGNELEATLTTLTLIGAGAWLATRPRLDRGAAAWFVAIAALAAAAFAPGRFGADVGAAIVLGVGGATAAVIALGLPVRRAILTVIAGGVLALAALFAVDLVAGGAHLSRSVLGAGDATDVLDVLDRRVELMTATFIHPVYPELLAASVVLLALAAWRRDDVLGWFGHAWAARAGFLGALVGILVGTVANDSGSVLLVIGTIYLAACAGFFWGSRDGAARRGSPDQGTAA